MKFRFHCASQSNVPLTANRTFLIEGKSETLTLNGSNGQKQISDVKLA